MPSELLWVGFKAFLIAVILTPITRDIFRSYNIVDRPGERKVHIHPIPRIGGIPIAIAYGLSLVALFDDAGSAGFLDRSLPILGIMPGALLIFLTGLLDDFFDLRPTIKLGGQILAALSVFLLGVRVETVGGYELGMWLSLPVTIFWLVLTTNAFNLIDGLDGLCAGVGLVATLALSGAAALAGNYQLLQVVVPLSGALLGFLIYNSNPATVFLGDSGALLIGFLLGCYGMVWTQKTAALISMAVPLIALLIPLLDVTLSVVRRSLKGQSIFGADRGHIHHRLVDRGLTPRRAVLVLYLVAGAAAGFAILLSSPRVEGYETMVILGALGVTAFGIWHLRYAELAALRSALLGGDFEGDFSKHIELETMKQKLQRASSEGQWWEALQEVLRDYGCVRVKWQTPSRSYEADLIPEEPESTIAVSAGGEDRLEIGAPAEVHAELENAAFVSLICESLRAHRRAWEGQLVR